jgi:hypothetical protein
MRNANPQNSGSRKWTAKRYCAQYSPGFWLLAPGFLCLAFLGCIGSPQNPAATQPATVRDPATTQPGYWYDKPAVASIESNDFDLLVQRIERTLRDYCFKIDRVDYRLGLITTEPMVAAQFFEPWRRDNQSAEFVTRASLATYRRTAEVQITRGDNGVFVASPKVVIEKQTIVGQRITSVVLYKGAFKPNPNPKDRPSGSKESDQGILIPAKDWYAVARDEKLEQKLAEEIRGSLK